MMDTETAQDKMKEGAQQAQSRAREQIGQRSSQAGDQVSATAQALRSTGQQLREQGRDTQADAAERVAHHADRMGSYLTESDADRLLNDIEDFGRRQPMAVVGIGIAVGFAASRFLKASSRKRYQGYQADPNRYQEGAQLPVPSGGTYGS
jgi:ElaB/YqjD/DUF883 family membrane-anchored ribosome-binding protein